MLLTENKVITCQVHMCANRVRAAKPGSVLFAKASKVVSMRYRVKDLTENML